MALISTHDPFARRRSLAARRPNLSTFAHCPLNAHLRQPEDRRGASAVTIRAVSFATPSPEAETTADRDGSTTAVAFAVDSGYLTPLKVMIHSMARAGTMLDAPVWIYSDDPTVFDDPFVARLTDRAIHIDGSLRDELYEVAADHIQRPERLDWNRGTCLKWAVFDDCDVEQILFLDADMLCLAPLEPLLETALGFDLVGAPQFQRHSLLFDDGEAASISFTEERIAAMLDGTAHNLMGRLNSGVMLVRKPLLSRRFRDDLVSYAKRGTSVNEQSHITSYFRSDHQDQWRMRLVTSSFNFHEAYLGKVDPVTAFQWLDRIRVLHFAGSPKPWKSETTAASRLTDVLWRQFCSSQEHAESELSRAR
jgi:lipopolysaccharide biosynthesis glycosyltransferase